MGELLGAAFALALIFLAAGLMLSLPPPLLTVVLGVAVGWLLKKIFKDW